MSAKLLGTSATATAAILAMATMSFAQEPPPATTVSPQEYEQLKRDFDQMRRRLDAVEVRAEAVADAPATRPAAERPVGDELGFGLSLDPSPRWERPDGWMTPAFRAEEMDLRVGRAGSIDLYIGLQTAGRFQALDHDDVFIAGVEQESLDPSFQTAWGDLSFLADIDDGKMLVFFDLYISSRPHPSTMYGNEGYMLVHELPDNLAGNEWLNNTLFKYVSVKAGHFEIDYGDHRYRRSDNAWVQRNPLIGNYIVDPDVEEIGMEVFSKPQALNWLVGISSGTTTENLAEGRGIASVHGKLWSDITDDLRAAVSGYYVDHSDNPPGGLGGTKGSLFSGRRSGDPFGGVLAGGNAPGQVLPGKDQLVTAFQGDLTWSLNPWEFYGHFGWMQDEDPNGSLPGSAEERWMYGAAEAVYQINPRLYAAARYSMATALDIAGQPSDGQVHRIEVGGGYWLTRNMLGKASYVYQTYQDFDLADGMVSGVDAAADPSFHGLMLEVSFAF